MGTRGIYDFFLKTENILKNELNSRKN